jgi:hypothetical protein
LQACARHHTLIITARSRPQAPKTGCTQFQTFLLYVNENISLFDRIHADPGLIHNMYGLMLHARWSSYNASLSDDVSRWDRVWIARNPYVRFLSSYLDWGSRNAAHLKARNTSVGFERFTSMYERSLTESGVPFSGWVYLPSHVRPVTQVCKADQFGVDVVLRLEQVRARPLSTSPRPLHPTHTLSLKCVPARHADGPLVRHSDAPLRP